MTILIRRPWIALLTLLAFCTLAQSQGSSAKDPKARGAGPNPVIETILSQPAYSARDLEMDLAVLRNRDIYLAPPNATGCGLTRVANGAGSVCTACWARR